VEGDARPRAVVRGRLGRCYYVDERTNCPYLDRHRGPDDVLSGLRSYLPGV
jgi:hypothetical protein